MQTLLHAPCMHACKHFCMHHACISGLHMQTLLHAMHASQEPHATFFMCHACISRSHMQTLLHVPCMHLRSHMQTLLHVPCMHLRSLHVDTFSCAMHASQESHADTFACAMHVSPCMHLIKSHMQTLLHAPSHWCIYFIRSVHTSTYSMTSSPRHLLSRSSTSYAIVLE
jgi:hypothetical protein